MARIIPFCSSSSGNSVFIGTEREGVLIDAGCSYKQLRIYMELCGVSIDSIKAILITHGHSDHIKGLKQLTKQTGIPVYTSVGTAGEILKSDSISYNSELHNISDLKSIPASFCINAFPSSHDAAESVGFTFEYEDAYKIGYCTDTGIVTDIAKEKLTGSNMVFIESNYEPSLLQANARYPYFLKKRIASDLGHLSNIDCAKFITHLASTGTTRFILGHLSEENNRPELAYKNVADSLSAFGAMEGTDYTLAIAPVTVVEKAAVGNLIIRA